MIKYTHNSWSLELPDNWVSEAADEGMVFYNPDGVGVVQIISYLKEEGDISQQDLIEFSESDTTTEITLPYVKGITNTIVEGDDFFINWWLQSETELFYVSYVCEKGNESIEAEERDSLVASLKSHTS